MNNTTLCLQADTITADVKDGVFRILFKEDRLGYSLHGESYRPSPS
jgi:hypothetical protein